MLTDKQTQFVATVTRAKEEEARLEAIELDKRKLKGCLDQLTQSLITFEDQNDLVRKINDIYDKLDIDGSGGLNFEEFQMGLMEMISTISITRDDFDVITDHGKHLGPTSEFNSSQFQDMMKGELWRYSRRELNNVLSVSGDEQVSTHGHARTHARTNTHSHLNTVQSVSGNEPAASFLFSGGSC